MSTLTTATPAGLGSGAARTQQMLKAPLMRTLLRLAAPNIIGLLATTVVIGYDGFILGRLGPSALAGVALVLPASMLMLQMAAGGIGGATTAAVARALGAARTDDATRLAQHALFIACVAAAIFTIVHCLLGRAIYEAMGGQGAALAEALVYSNVLFGGALVIWLTHVLAAIVRGAGNMLQPSLAMLGAALAHLALCPLLVFGWGPIPALGIAGAAVSTLVSNAVAAMAMGVYLLRPAGAVNLRGLPWRLRAELLRGILRVGLPSSVGPLISNGSIALTTAFVGSFGLTALAGYGIAARLEYILVPIAFGFGTALTAMVATNLGAGQRERALRVTWAGSALVAAITGGIGLTAAVWPALWMNMFTADPAVHEFGGLYLNIVGASYGLFGLGLALHFSSQGAGRMAWPLAASIVRFTVLAAGGWACVYLFRVQPSGLFLVVAFSMAFYALTLTAAIRLGGWGR